MRLSKRMKKILGILAQYQNSTPDTVEKMKERLEREEKEKCIELYKQGERGQLVVPKKISYEEAKNKKFLKETSTQKWLIIVFELYEKYDKITDYQGYPTEEAVEQLEEIRDYYFSDYRMLSRYNVSLTEIIVGHLYPKGRMKFRCENFKDYKKVKKEADKLHASYSRTLKRMVEQDLIKKTDNRYMITDFGEETYKAKC